MAKTFGKYEVVAELYSTPDSSVYSARPSATPAAPGGAGGGDVREPTATKRGGGSGSPRELREVRYAVKVYNPTGLDLDELFWESQSFLERARLQQRTSDAGNGHWAPVHEMGTSPAGAYYVSDFHPLSAASLITGKIDVGPGVLYAIVRSVVSGLTELKETAGRSHGNLKATNVLISSRGDVAVAGAVLTDPAPAADAAKAGEAGDFYALGELIYLLVTGRPFPGGSAWPLPQTREWNRLGSQHSKLWRRLCNELLDPDPDSRPATLAAVARQLPRLAPRRPKRKARTLIAVASAVLFVALGAGTTLVVQDVAARRELCEAKERWAGPLDTALADPRRRAALEADPDLRIVVQEVKSAHLEMFDCPLPKGRFSLASLLPALNVNQFRQTQETLAAVRRANRGLSPTRWRGLARATELQGQFEGRGWAQPAAYLAERVAAARPGSADLAGGIERLLRSLAAADRDLLTAEAEWRLLQDRAEELDNSRDPVLRSFAALLRKSGASSVRLTENGIENVDGLRGAAARAAELVEARRRLLPGDYDEARFAEAVARNFPDPAQLTEADAKRWLDTLAAHAVRRAEIAAAAAALRQRADETAKDVLDSKPDPEDVAAFDAQKNKADTMIALFRGKPFIAQDLADGTFDADYKRAEAEVLALARFARREDPGEWLKTLAALNSTSPRVNQAWESWRASLERSARELARDPAGYSELKKQTDRLWNALGALERAFPPVPRDLPAPFATAAQKKRESALDALLDAHALAALAPASPAVSGAANTYAQWSKDLSDLAADFPIRKALLGPNDRPEARWLAPEKSAFWNDPVVQALVAADVARIGRLRALDGKPRAELAQVITSTDVAEVALHAWRLLGAETSEGQPAWPTREGELRRESELRTRVADLLRRDIPDAERAAAADEIAAQGPLRWRRFAEAARDEKMVGAAAELREEFGVGPAEFGRLAAATRFNLSLYAALRHVRGADPTDRTADGALSPVVEDLKQAVADLGDAPAAKEVARRLATLVGDEPFADRQLGETFEHRPLAVPVPIVFRRVEPKEPGQRPFYLGTTEVSFAQFFEVVEAHAAWRPVRPMVWAPAPGELSDPRRGPRVWEWAKGAPLKMDTPFYWLTPDEANTYPPEFRDPRNKFNQNLLGAAAGGSPSDRHPMQHVSPEAAMYFGALCGARLPTAGEWKTAHDLFARDVPPARWNLRDRTWEVQRDHVAASGRPGVTQAPDAGIFLPAKRRDAQPPAASTAADAGAAARGRAQDDKTLFFRPVDAPVPGGPTNEPFRHLVGNVAEYVLTDAAVAQAFEGLPATEKGTAPGVQRFVREHAAALAVIGGSALSPPELPLTDPLPVPVPPAGADGPAADSAAAPRGYADVGFRLAFTAPSRSLSERVGWALAGQQYVWPQAEPANARASAPAAHE